MRENGKGHIINIGSMSGIKGAACAGIYCSTKFALEGLTESLALEINQLGIKVTLFELGAYKTKFFKNLLISPHIKEYNKTAKIIRKLVKKGYLKLDEPDKIVKKIVNISHMKNPPFRIMLGKDALNIAKQKVKEMSLSIKSSEKDYN
jgi:short-subunit dehydrogenase